MNGCVENINKSEELWNESSYMSIVNYFKFIVRAKMQQSKTKIVILV